MPASASPVVVIDDPLLLLSLIGGGLLVWSLLSGVLFRLSAAIHNRWCREEVRVRALSWLHAMLGGFVAVGAGVVATIVVTYTLVVAQVVLFSSGTITPEQMASTAVAVLQSGLQIAALQIVKLLVSIAFLPCRLRPAVWIGFHWQLLECLLFLAIAAVWSTQAVEIALAEGTFFVLDVG